MIKDRLGELKTKSEINKINKINWKGTKIMRVPLSANVKKNAKMNYEDDQFLKQECDVRNQIEDLTVLLKQIKNYVDNNCLNNTVINEFNKKAEKICIDLNQLKTVMLETEVNTLLKTVRKNLYNSLISKYKNILINYENITEIQKEKIKSVLKSEMLICGYQLSDENLNALIEKNEVQFFSENYVLKSQEEKTHLLNLEYQYEAFQNLESSLAELNSIIAKLALMVAEQGVAVDRIDYAINNTKSSAHDAVKNLQEASHKKNRNRKCKLILFLLIVVFIIIFLAIFLT